MKWTSPRLQHAAGAVGIFAFGRAIMRPRRGNVRQLICIIALVLTSCALAKSQTATQSPQQSASTGTSSDRATSAESSASAVPSGSAPVPQNNTISAPDPQRSADSDQDGQQTKRILGIIPNFRAISSGEHLPAQSASEKFKTATEDSFDYSSIFIPAMLAVYSEETSATPEFGTGAVGYGRYFWHAAVDQTSENYMVEFVVPVITHEDTRYYTLGHGSFFKRTSYALSRAVITRSDSGNDTFNFSEVVGAGASSGLSSLYYPSRERSLSNTGTEWGLDIAIDAASFVAKEFWPDINRHIFRQGTSSSPSDPNKH
jgi:hypothetical protein